MGGGTPSLHCMTLNYIALYITFWLRWIIALHYNKFVMKCNGITVQCNVTTLQFGRRGSVGGGTLSLPD